MRGLCVGGDMEQTFLENRHLPRLFTNPPSKPMPRFATTFRQTIFTDEDITTVPVKNP